MKKRTCLYLCAIIFLLWGCNQPKTEPTLTSAKLSCERDQIEVDETLAITYALEPADAPVDADSFCLTGGSITLQDGKALYTCDKPGTYTIFFREGDVKSNTLTIQVHEPEVQPTQDANEQTEESPQTTTPITGNTPTPHNAPMNVDALLEQAAVYVDTGVQVWVQGDLPQAAITDANGELQQILWNDDHTRYILLNGEVNIGGCRASIVGTLTMDEQQRVVIQVDSVQQMN